MPHEARFFSSIWGSRSKLDELLDLPRQEPSIVQPVETLPLVEAQQAHDRLRAAEVRGRLVLVVSEPEFVRSNFVNGIEHVEVRIR